MAARTTAQALEVLFISGESVFSRVTAQFLEVAYIESSGVNLDTEHKYWLYL